jgi:hypothetical protein
MSKSDWLGAVAYAAGIVLVCAFALWLILFAPCEVFGWATVGQIPVRCLSEYVLR